MLTSAETESISRIEDRLSQISDGRETGFEIPTFVQTFAPGVEVAVLQLIISWASARKDAPIHSRVHAGSSLQDSLRSMLQQPYALVAMLARPQLRAAGGQDISNEAAVLAAEAYRTEKPPFHVSLISRDTSLIVASSALAPTSYAPLLALATPGERSTRQAAFLRHVEHALNAFYTLTKTAPIFRRQSLPQILYELFANAEEWGGTNVHNRPVQIPLRGILLRVHTIARVTQNATDSPVAAFLVGLKGLPDCKYVLEASVFDSGIGLAQRHLKRQVLREEPLTEELKAVQTCLKKHGTSSGNSSRGLGLHHVMELTTVMKGFLRIRSGRLHLYRDFNQDAYLFSNPSVSTPISSGQFGQYMRDWRSGAHAVLVTTPNTETIPKNIFPYAPVRGAAFNLLLPLKDSQLTFTYE